eukprot:jgi/Galph1/5118/GphlegSOOS_G3774.1
MSSEVLALVEALPCLLKAETEYPTCKEKEERGASFALEMLLSSLPKLVPGFSSPTETAPRNLYKADETRFIVQKEETSENLSKQVAKLREELQKRKNLLERLGLPVNILFCYHIPLSFTEESFRKLLCEGLGIVGYTRIYLETSKKQTSKVCWVEFVSNDWCELVVEKLLKLQLEQYPTALPFRFNFSLPENDDIVQMKTNTGIKRKRISKLEQSVVAARELGVTACILFFDYIDPRVTELEFRRLLLESTRGLAYVRLTEPLLRTPTNGDRKPTCLIESSRLGWAIYKSETHCLNALAYIRSHNLLDFGIGVPKLDQTDTKKKQNPKRFFSARQQRSKISALNELRKWNVSSDYDNNS